MKLAQKETEAWSGKQAENYSHSVRERFPVYEEMHAMVQTAMRSALPDEARILIVGCGIGEEVIRLSKCSAGWKILAVDTSEDMVQIAQRAIIEHDLSSRVHVRLQSVLDVEEKDFDAATILLVNHFLEDTPDGKSLLLQSVSDRLVGGGTLMYADLCGEVGNPLFEDLYQLWKATVLERARDRESWEERFDWVRDIVTFSPPERLLELCGQAQLGQPIELLNWFTLKLWKLRKANTS